MKDIVIDHYNNADLPAFQEYVKRLFDEKYILSDPRYLDWQYGGQFYVARKGAEIIGHFGFRDSQYKISGRIKPIRVLMNLSVLKDYELSGVGGLLAHQALLTDNPVIVFRYRPPAHKLFSHLRAEWQDRGFLNRYLAVLNPHAALFQNYSEISRYELKKNSFDGLGSNITAEAVSDIREEWPEFWAGIRSRYPVTVERAPEYMSWRFWNNSFLKYEVIAARNKGKLAGCLIWRLEEDQGFRIARIIDLVAEEIAELPLLTEFLRLAKDVRADSADFMFSGNWYEQSMIKAGFFNTAQTELKTFPTLFSPISDSRPFINVGSDLDVLLNDCYFTKADGDQDRPNPH